MAKMAASSVAMRHHGEMAWQWRASIISNGGNGVMAHRRSESKQRRNGGINKQLSAEMKM
jgi:hypothetical protein